MEQYFSRAGNLADPNQMKEARAPGRDGECWSQQEGVRPSGRRHSGQVFRAVSDAKTLTGTEHPSVLRDWHIIMVLLTLNVDVVLVSSQERDM